MHLLDNIVQARSGGRVERCHAVPHLGSYSNAAHQWGVAMLMWYLWPQDFPRLGIYCLTHDVPESWVGDIPAPTLRYVPGLRDQLGAQEERLNRGLGLLPEQELNAEDHAKLKACDRLELLFWCFEQELMGNRFVAETTVELMKYLDEVCNAGKMPSPADELYSLMVASADTRAEVFLPKQAGVMERINRG